MRLFPAKVFRCSMYEQICIMGTWKPAGLPGPRAAEARGGWEGIQSTQKREGHSPAFQVFLDLLCDGWPWPWDRSGVGGLTLGEWVHCIFFLCWNAFVLFCYWDTGKSPKCKSEILNHWVGLEWNDLWWELPCTVPKTEHWISIF